MNELIAKRLDYVNKIKAIRDKVDVDMATYKTELNKQFSEKLASYRAQLNAQAEEAIKKYQRRIDVLDEMITDEVPEATTLNNLIHEAEETKVIIPETDVQSVEEVDSIPEDATVVDTVELTEAYPEYEDVLCEDLAEGMTVIEMADANVVVKEDEVKISEAVQTETIAQTLDRPGMAQIVIPSRI